MNIVFETVRELLGLFVEDISLTVGIVVALAVARWGVPRLGLDPRWSGGVLFLMLVVVLLENVHRSARR